MKNLLGAVLMTFGLIGCGVQGEPGTGGESAEPALQEQALTTYSGNCYLYAVRPPYVYGELGVCGSTATQGMSSSGGGCKIAGTGYNGVVSHTSWGQAYSAAETCMYTH